MFLLPLSLAACAFFRLNIVHKRYKSLECSSFLFCCLEFSRRQSFPIEYFVQTCKRNQIRNKIFAPWNLSTHIWYVMKIEQRRNLCSLAGVIDDMARIHYPRGELLAAESVVIWSLFVVVYHRLGGGSLPPRGLPFCLWGILLSARDHPQARIL